MRTSLRAIAALSAALLVVTGPCATLRAEAQTTANTNASFTGNVVDQQSGLPVSGATITLTRAGSTVATATTDGDGTFTFPAEAAGIYSIGISAQGYERSIVSDEALTSTGTTALRIVIQRAASSQGGLHEIGRTSVTGSRNALATTTVINRNISADLIQKEANLRVGDALLAAPGLTSFNLDSAPGDDLNISIRGQRPSEAQALVDGDPIGPIGVFGGTNGGFNYQLSPSAALHNVEITYGTGGSALSGVDAIAGTIDFQTINPTREREFGINQSFGTQGRRQTTLSATGTAGRLGYALLNSVQGTWGGFQPGAVTQSGLLGGDLTSANVAANTWLVSGNYVLRNNLVKLRYELNPTTALTAQAYIGTSWDDKTGEGDNDFQTPQIVAYGAAQGGATPCTLSNGSGGYVAKTDANPNACFTPAQYAAAFSGPAGGTPLAFQTLSLQDYSARLNSTIGRNAVTVEGFANKYDQVYDRNLAGFTNAYWTIGERVSDDIVGDRNTVGFGYLGIHQLYTAGNYGSTGVTYQPDLGSSVGNVFVRDIFNATPHLQIFANANLKSANVSKQTTVDPRLSLVYRPNNADVFRVSAGRANEAPSVQLKSGNPNVSTQPGALNPNCGLNSIGSAPNPTIVNESANEIELSYGHHFGADSQVQVVAYENDVTNALFSNVLPLSTFGPGAVPANLADYLNRIDVVGHCATPATIANLGLSTTANAGAGRFRGIDLTGRLRVNHNVYLDYGYDLISARYFGIPDVSLRRNVLLVDGGQIQSVPFDKGNLGLDVTFGSTEARVDGFYVGRNNGLNRPAYTYFNGFVSHRLAKNLTLNLGVENIFNSQYDQYGRIGYAQYIPENQYGTDATVLDQALNGNGGERFALPERSIVLGISTRVH